MASEGDSASRQQATKPKRDPTKTTAARPKKPSAKKPADGATAKVPASRKKSSAPRARVSPAKAQANHEVAFESLCRVCNGRPVADATFEVVRGFLLAYTRQEIEGPFCRTCGEATYREATARTLMLCWFGTMSFGLGIRAFIRNRRMRKRIVALPEMDGSSGDPTARLDPGRPVWRRAGGIVGIAVSTVFALLILSVILVAFEGQSALYEGECVRVTQADQTVETVDCAGPHDGRVISVIGTDAKCPPDAEFAISLEDDAAKALCIDADR